MAALITLLALTWATGAFGATGKPAVAADNPPREIKPIRDAGLVCRADTPNFRAWWGDSPGGAGALAGADGNCSTVPSIVSDTLQAAEALRLASNAAGFPAIVGDRPLAFRRDGAWYRRTIRQKPRNRAIALGRISPASRGPLLAGLLPNERARIYRGLTSRLVKGLTRDAARARRPPDGLRRR